MLILCSCPWSFQKGRWQERNGNEFKFIQSFIINYLPAKTKKLSQAFSICISMVNLRSKKYFRSAHQSGGISVMPFKQEPPLGFGKALNSVLNVRESLKYNSFHCEFENYVCLWDSSCEIRQKTSLSFQFQVSGDYGAPKVPFIETISCMSHTAILLVPWKGTEIVIRVPSNCKTFPCCYNILHVVKHVPCSCVSKNATALMNKNERFLFWCTLAGWLRPLTSHIYAD